MARGTRAKPSGPVRFSHLYVHTPFCDTLCYDCGCNTRDYTKGCHYLNYLLREIDVIAVLIGPERIVRQLHWGRGTPTYLKPADIARLAAHLRALLELERDGLVSISDTQITVTELGRVIPALYKLQIRYLARVPARASPCSRNAQAGIRV